MPELQSVGRILTALVDRLRNEELDEPGQEDPGLSPLVYVGGEIGRALAESSEGDVRKVLPAIAMLREECETLRYAGSTPETPYQALKASSEQAIPFAAGALWGWASSLESWLQHRSAMSGRAVARASRNDIREAIQSLLDKEEVIQPSTVMDFFAENRGQEVDPSQVSKAIGDLMEDGIVQPALAAKGDRRNRYYTLTDAANEMPAPLIRCLQQAAETASAYVSADTATHLFAEFMSRQGPQNDAPWRITPKGRDPSS